MKTGNTFKRSSFLRYEVMEIRRSIAEAKEIFYRLHRHPELSGQEFKTTEYIKQVLSDNDIPVYPLSLNTGLVAHLGCGKPVVAFRCDIDALPMTEESGLAYASEYPGRMHACGHDFHTASLLGIALTLRNCLPLQGTVKLIFQPEEENMAGARQVLQTGILDDVEVIFGLHCCAAYPKGTVISRPGFMNGAVDEFHIDFYGNGAHACRPHQSADPIIMIASFVQEAQTIVSRNTAPFHPVVVGITRIGSGTAKNIIPETGFVEGTVRSLYPEDRRMIKERIFCLAGGIAANYGGKADIGFVEGPPATNNEASWVALAEKIADEQGLPFTKAPDSLSGEDFAFYQQKIPGAFIQIGTGIGPMMHNPAFRADPDTLNDAIPFGVALVKAALAALR